MPATEIASQSSLRVGTCCYEYVMGTSQAATIRFVISAFQKVTGPCVLANTIFLFRRRQLECGFIGIYKIDYWHMLHIGLLLFHATIRRAVSSIIAHQSFRMPVIGVSLLVSRLYYRRIKL